MGLWSGFVTPPLLTALALGVAAMAVTWVSVDGDTRSATLVRGGPTEQSAPPQPDRTAPVEREKEAERADPAETENTGTGESETIEATVRFPHNGTRLTGREITELRRFVAEASDREIAWVRIDGYGDATGTDEANLWVSLRRSEAVADFLREEMPAEGVEFVTVGHGANDPVADNGTAAGRARNRRAEASAGTVPPRCGEDEERTASRPAETSAPLPPDRSPPGPR